MRLGTMADGQRAPGRGEKNRSTAIVPIRVAAGDDRGAGGSPVVRRRRMGSIRADPGPGAGDVRAHLLQVVPGRMGGAREDPDRRRRAARGQPRRRDPLGRARDHARDREGARAPGLRPGRLLLPHRAGRRHAVGPRRRGLRPARQRLPPAEGAAAARARCSPKGPRARPSPSPTATSCAGSDGAASSRSPCGPGVPVIPIAVVGSEEAMPVVLRLPTLAKALGPPLLPDHGQPARLRAARRRRCPSPPSSSCRVLDPVRFDVPPDQERYSKSRIMEESERIRAQLQEAVYDMLRDRRSVWFG